MTHVSYSEIKIWHECPFKHKLQYVDRIAGFKGNLHTAFGTAMHSVCENGLLNEELDREQHFLEAFANEVLSLKKRLNEIYSKHTGKSADEIKTALERDNFMTPQDAKNFGLIDKVVEKRD